MFSFCSESGKRCERDGHNCPPFSGASQVYIIDWEHYLPGEEKIVSLGVLWGNVQEVSAISE